MTTNAKIVCDSVSPAGARLTTFECVFPRIILAEINTHRVLSRNSASSRAIPVEKMIQRVQEDPYVPTHWGKNQRGMQAEQDVSPEDAYAARQRWLWARDSAVSAAERLLQLGIHKQITNRLLEPFMWHTAIITATEWANFFNLRDNAAAHPDFRDLAHAMRELYASSEPEPLDYEEWHQPLIGPEDIDAAFELGIQGADSKVLDELMTKVSIGRCARVSYLTHKGKRDLKADVDLCDRLLTSGHMSPFEHVARPISIDEMTVWKSTVSIEIGRPPKYVTGTPFCGNFRGWIQYRKLIPNEWDILGAVK